ncbi:MULTISPECIES: hypothetical protein [Sinirhodobacter]|uniref:Uncharacterized protein n=2 Tax=Paenirhodobacter TaxID=1470577 RepID=A0A443LZT8_9RHOB|nr:MULTISPECIES: hypothetical protein [Sinirhodobacter]RWR51888.1 hypothetical protein EOW65_03260 [Sinirhodobacter ferrireducens]RWR54739.1 hypothetical protein EOW66_01350 [Sinirhodobacter huangdaonensis]
MTAEHADTKDNSAQMYLLALVIIGIAVGLVAFMGLGGLILWAVVATWIMLAFLVVMTAGG